MIAAVSEVSSIGHASGLPGVGSTRPRVGPPSLDCRSGGRRLRVGGASSLAPGRAARSCLRPVGLRSRRPAILPRHVTAGIMRALPSARGRRAEATPGRARRATRAASLRSGSLPVPTTRRTASSGACRRGEVPTAASRRMSVQPLSARQPRTRSSRRSISAPTGPSQRRGPDRRRGGGRVPGERVRAAIGRVEVRRGGCRHPRGNSAGTVVIVAPSVRARWTARASLRASPPRGASPDASLPARSPPHRLGRSAGRPVHWIVLAVRLTPALRERSPWPAGTRSTS